MSAKDRTARECRSAQDEGSPVRYPARGRALWVGLQPDAFRARRGARPKPDAQRVTPSGPGRTKGER